VQTPSPGLQRRRLGWVSQRATRVRPTSAPLAHLRFLRGAITSRDDGLPACGIIVDACSDLSPIRALMRSRADRVFGQPETGKIAWAALPRAGAGLF